MSNFQQGGYGDCQSLVVINALGRTEAGEAYLKGLTEKSGDGGYIVKFPGREYITISPAEMSDPNLMSTDNDSYKALEAATIKVHKKQEGVVDPIGLYMGKDTKSYMYDLKSNGGDVATLAQSPMSKPLIESVQDGRAIMVGGVGTPTTITDTNGHVHDLPGPHAYTMFLDKDNPNNVQFENPHDTSQRITVTRDAASAAFKDVTISPTPGNDIKFPPEYQKAADLSADASGKLHKAWETGGAWSVGDVKLSPEQQQVNNQAYDEYFAAKKDLATGISQLSAQVSQIDAKEKSREYMQKSGDSSNLIAQEIRDRGRENEFYTEFAKDAKPGSYDRDKLTIDDRASLDKKIDKLKNNGVLTEETSDLFKKKISEATTLGDIKSFTREVDDKASGKKAIVNEQAISAQPGVASVEQPSVQQPAASAPQQAVPQQQETAKLAGVNDDAMKKAMELMKGLGVNSSSLSSNIDNGSQVASQAIRGGDISKSAGVVLA